MDLVSCYRIETQLFRVVGALSNLTWGKEDVSSNLIEGLYFTISDLFCFSLS